MIRPSIRRKLLLSIAGIVLLLGLVLVILNGTLLQSYYMFMEKRMLGRQTEAIVDVIDGTDDDAGLSDALKQIERRNNLIISIIGPDGSPRYFTRVGLMDQPFDRMPEARPAPQSKNQPLSILKSEQLPDGTTYELQKDLKLDVSYMTMKKTLSDGSSVDVRVMLSSIERGAAIASTFTAYAVLLGLIGSVVWAIRFSKRFTQPLVQMNEITRNISQLDFTKKCETGQPDELGQLGSSINELSDRLSAALSDLKAKNELLEKELVRERGIDRMRKEFVANVSHELRTPISIIQGYADGLKMNIAGDEKKRRFYSDVIIDEADRMNRLVSDLLELSQYENGSVQLKKDRFDLSALILRIFERCLSDEQKASVELCIPQEAWGFADERRMEQVLINFVNNAVEHLEPRGRIRVTLASTDENAAYRISVGNDGAHISEESLPRIWDSFYRADKARSRENGRYGLGLSIVRAIQDMHGMGYGARNTEGGVEFWADVARG